MDYAPQLATLVARPPEGDDWIHEIKFDGYRIGCRLDHGRVSLTSRNGLDWTARFPEVAAAAARLPAVEALIDGEVAVMRPDGRTDFQALQHALSGSRPRGDLVFIAFDLLSLDGVALADLPLEARKERLRTLVGQGPPGRIRFADHVTGNGAALFAEAQRLGLEGIVSKRRQGPYRPGRSRDWTKAKCMRQEAFVIGGFTDQAGSTGHLGALVLGQFAEGGLAFTGSVGTGFSREEADRLRMTLASLEQTACPFVRTPTGPAVRRARWVRPALVCTVRFTEWTDEGRIRHPSYQGLRQGADPTAVLRRG